MALTTATAHAWLAEFGRVVHENTTYLTDLDRAIGDADHGSNMSRGSKAAAELDPTAFPTAADLLKKVGMTLVSTVGGASGPLYGTFFLRFAAALPAGDADTAAVGAALRAGVGGIVARGKAQAGDKTMLDALLPAVDAFDAAADQGEAAAWAAAAAAAAHGRDATVPMVARKGRASYLGERSAGHQDPGATSATMLIEAAAATLG